ncbi:MAG: hypothetical protein QOJ51_6872 [Acidobacteriaceae bacterium]|nr:hypothetical protein [Acidobacteriaceae bacterium]
MTKRTLSCFGIVSLFLPVSLLAEQCHRFGKPSFGFVTAAQSPRLIRFASKLHY